MNENVLFKDFSIKKKLNPTINKLIIDLEKINIKIHISIIIKLIIEVNGFFVILSKDNFKVFKKVISYFDINIRLYTINNISITNNKIKGIDNIKRLLLERIIKKSNIIKQNINNEGIQTFKEFTKLFL